MQNGDRSSNRNNRPPETQKLLYVSKQIWNGAALTLNSESGSETRTYQEKNQQPPLEKAAPDFRGLKRWSSNRTYTALNLRQGTNVRTCERLRKYDELERQMERRRKNDATVMRRKALLASPSPGSTSWWMRGGATAVVHKGSTRGRSDGCGSARAISARTYQRKRADNVSVSTLVYIKRIHKLTSL